MEWVLDHDFSILNYLKGREVKVIAIPLHWHHQSYDSIELTRRVKETYPKVYLVLGGYTASYFDKKILKEFEFIDGIIRGDGERPISSLVRAVTRKKTFEQVPNLTWRQGNKIVRNKLSYVAAQEDLDQLSFTDFRLLKNYQT